MTVDSRGWFRRATQPVVLALGFAILVSISLASITLASKRQADADALTRTLEVKNRLATLLLEVRRTENAHRGFLLTGANEYLNGYYQATDRIIPAFQDVRRATANPLQQRALAALEPMLQRKIAEMQESVRLYQAGDHAGSVAAFRSGDARALTREIRDAIEQMDQDENQLLAIQTAESISRANTVLALELLGVGVIIGLAGISILTVRRSNAEREAAMKELADANAKLESTVTERTAHLRATSEESTRVADILRGTIDSMSDAVRVALPDGRIVLSNPAADRLFGSRPDIGSEEWRRKYRRYYPDGMTPLPIEETPLNRMLRGEPVENVEFVLQHPDETRIHILANGRPMRGEDGTFKGAVVVYRDITEARETERQLRHAQKMDAVGQLTGGVAHDFNNILTVITGTIEILAEGVADKPKLAQIARMIDEAAGRGAELTRHLLAFARKQPLQPRETDVNRLITDAAKLLRPTLGEQVEIETSLEADAWPALVDSGLLTTSLFNLAINARDAMPGGGKLTLESDNVILDETYVHAQADVTPGPYVLVAVSDTGLGMSAAVRERVFEPFFTTKDIGKGTGLGLSMVYGFVKQSGGHIKVYSEEGHGTTVKIYLPRAVQQSVEEVKTPAAVIESGYETILIVEDDALVREHVIGQLQHLGYTTFAAANAVEALRLAEGGVTFDLLFTDVIMPGGMNGRELAEEMAKRQPSIRVLFTSGYTENAIMHHGRLDAGVLLLPKPYRKSDLARMVRQALAQPSAAWKERPKVVAMRS